MTEAEILLLREGMQWGLIDIIQMMFSLLVPFVIILALYISVFFVLKLFRWILDTLGAREPRSGY